MDERQMALEKVPHPIHINFKYPPYPGADLKTIELDLPEGALLLDAIRQCRIQHHVPVYLEHSFLSTAQSLIESTRRARVDQETAQVNTTLFSQEHKTTALETAPEEDDTAESDLQRAMIENYRNNTSQFYTQPEENMFPEAYHTLVHSPIPLLFDSILDLEREYAGEVDALLSARDAEINDIQTRHNNILAAEAPQRNLTQLMTRHIERMEVSQATWNSQLDDLQSMQRSKYQEFILELYAIYRRRQLYHSHKDTSNGSANGLAPLDGKEMVAEAMRTIGTRQSNVDGTPSDQSLQLHSTSTSKDLPSIPLESASQPETMNAEEPITQPPKEPPPEMPTPDMYHGIAPVDSPPPPPPPAKEDPELEKMIKSILEMGFDVEQAKGALLISNRNMDHALNMLLEQPENIPRLVAAKQKMDAMKESSARRQNRAQSSPQQPLPSLTGSPASNSLQPHPNPAQDPRVQNVNRPIDRSASVSYPRPHIPNQGSSGGAVSQKPWSPLPFLQQQKNALLTNNSNPSVKKFGGWLNKAMENLGLDDDAEGQNGTSRNGGSSGAGQSSQQVSNLAESFTVVLGSSHSKVTHNLRLVVSDPAEVFPSNRVKSERDAAIQAQTASSLYGKNLTGLVQLVNIRDWAKYKGGQVCHQEFFKACQTSTELHFDSIEKQLEALEDDIPLDGSTLQEGDFVLTRHSNLPMIHVVFHLFYGAPSSISDPSTAGNAGTGNGSPNLFNQSSDFVPKPNFLAGLRNIMRTAHRHEITMLSLPFLMMPTTFENQLVVVPELTPPTRHHRSGSQYGSPSLSAISTGAAGAGTVAPSPSVSSLSSFNAGTQHQQQQQQQLHINYHITDQTRRDLQKRTETILRHLKSYLMENARQVKQVGNQGSEAEKFRASQGGDVMVVQFLLPKGTSDEMFRSFRVLLVHVFGGV
ncbi:hypothetical protein BGW39_006777 [Mortierella sp. 14UC]|nr:hypothetical protein BGW39_006777 [Mortierella sp. 14UC]